MPPAAALLPIPPRIPPQLPLLIRSDPSLHSYEIAEKVGLGENPHYFSQLFRKYTGMTPKDYRKQLDEQTGQG